MLASHDEKIELYLANLDEVFFDLKKHIDSSINIESILVSGKGIQDLRLN